MRMSFDNHVKHCEEYEEDRQSGDTGGYSGLFGIVAAGAHKFGVNPGSGAGREHQTDPNRTHIIMITDASVDFISYLCYISYC